MWSWKWNYNLPFQTLFQSLQAFPLIFQVSEHSHQCIMVLQIVWIVLGELNKSLYGSLTLSLSIWMAWQWAVVLYCVVWLKNKRNGQNNTSWQSKRGWSWTDSQRGRKRGSNITKMTIKTYQYRSKIFHNVDTHFEITFWDKKCLYSSLLYALYEYLVKWTCHFILAPYRRRRFVIPACGWQGKRWYSSLMICSRKTSGIFKFSFVLLLKSYRLSHLNSWQMERFPRQMIIDKIPPEILVIYHFMNEQLSRVLISSKTLSSTYKVTVREESVAHFCS